MKITVKIPVVVDRKGNWGAHGLGTASGLREDCDHGDILEWGITEEGNERFYWLEAELDVPEIAAVTVNAVIAEEQP